MTTIFEHIINTIKVDPRRGPAPDGKYHADCPLCGKQHKPGQTHFVVMPNKSGSGHNYRCYVCGEGGSLSQLAKKLGIATYEPRKETIYPYYDEEGQLLYEVVRLEPGKNGKKKDFFQRLPGIEKKGIGNVRRVLYNLPALVERKDDTLYIVEGEKDVERLRSLGFLATSNVGGGGNWRASYALQIPQKQIVIVPDNDETGRKHTQDVARSLAERQPKVLHLPDLPITGDVSDWLNNGRDIEQLQELAASAPVWEPEEREASKHDEDEDKPTHVLYLHPETKAIMPTGYYIQNNTIQQKGRTIYNGIISVTNTGKNLVTGDEWVTVAWSGRGVSNSERIARADLGSGETLRKIMAARGAAIHAKNTGDVSAFLSDLIQENYDTLPRVEYVDRYGLVDDGLVLPGGTIGINPTPTYTGKTITIGNDATVFPSILRDIEGWTQTRILWLVLALTLASPAITRMKHDRNPVVYLGGPSGTGKTTLANLALGMYGDPRPQTIQCGSGTTTRVGIQQAITKACGMPIFFEDVHAMLTERDQARKITGTIYDFANKQGRFLGSLDQQGRGGEIIGGTLLMAGELLPEFTNAGQQNRTFTIDCGIHPPLGVRAGCAEGEERAQIIKAAAAGYGLFGHAIHERIWRNWNQYINDVQALSSHKHVSGLAAWAPLLAAATVALRIAFIESELDLSYDLPLILMHDWAELLQESRTKREPADEAYDKLILMLAQSRLIRYDDLPTWEFLEHKNTMVAGHLHTDTFWRVPTGGLFEDIMGQGVIFQFGRKWLTERKIVTHTGKEKVSAKCRVGRGIVRSILIPTSVIGYTDV